MIAIFTYSCRYNPFPINHLLYLLVITPGMRPGKRKILWILVPLTILLSFLLTHSQQQLKQRWIKDWPVDLGLEYSRLSRFLNICLGHR